MSRTLAVVFDFDETLAHDSTSGLIASLGLDPDHFWKHDVQPLLDDDWDPIPAYLHTLLEHSRAHPPEQRITAERLREHGRPIQFFSGVVTTFRELRKAVAEVDPAITVEFYLISSGIGEVLRASRIAHEFTDIWACDFAYNERGCIHAVKNVVSFTEKTRFIFQISKGLVGPEYRGKPSEVNRKIRGGRFAIPFAHMAYVGDGLTDIPCFQIVGQPRGRDGAKGFTIAVFDPRRRQKWGMTWELVESNRVDAVCTAEYGKHGSVRQLLIAWATDRARTIRDRSGPS